MTAAQLGDVLGVFQMRTHREAVAFMHRIVEARSWMTHIIAQVCLGRLTQPHMLPMLAVIGQSKLLSADDVAKITAPTVVVWGQGERLLPESALDFFKKHLPDTAEFDYPERMGHVPHSDRPGYMCRLLESRALQWMAPADESA